MQPYSEQQILNYFEEHRDSFAQRTKVRCLPSILNQSTVNPFAPKPSMYNYAFIEIMPEVDCMDFPSVGGALYELEEYQRQYWERLLADYEIHFDTEPPLSLYVFHAPETGVDENSDSMVGKLICWDGEGNEVELARVTVPFDNREAAFQEEEKRDALHTLFYMFTGELNRIWDELA